MKWIVILLVLLISCSEEVEYLNKVDPYSAYINREIELIRDCYLINALDSSNQSKYPQITCNSGIPGASDNRVPKNVSYEMIGETIGSIKVLDVIPRGSRLRVINVRKSSNIEMTYLYYEIGLIVDGEIKQMIDAIRILDRSRDDKFIHNKIAKLL